MNYKKTWFGWLNFTVGTLFMSVFIFTLLVSLFEFNGLTMFLFDYAWLKASFIVAGASIICAAGLLIIIHYIKRKIPINDKIFNHGICGFIYVLLFLGVLAGGIYLRYLKVIDFNSNSVLNQAYYIKVMEFFEGNTYGGSDLFVTAFGYIYSFLLKVFGLDPKILIITNYVFQVVGAVFICKAIRHSFGKSGSLCGFVLLMLLPGPVNYATVIGPDSLIFFFVSAITLIFSLLIRDREEGYMRSNSNAILFVLVGIVFGLLICINPVFVLVPLFFVCRILLLESNDEQKDIAINRKTLPALSMLISCIVSTGLFFALSMFYKGNSLEYAFKNYCAKIGFSGYLRIFYPDELIIICLIILVLCFTAYINFIFSKKDNISALTFLLITIYFVYAKNMISFDTSIYLLVLLGTLAGIGVKSLLFEGYAGDIRVVKLQGDFDDISREDSAIEDFNESIVDEEESDMAVDSEMTKDAEVSMVVSESSEIKKEKFVEADILVTDISMISTESDYEDVADSEDFMFLNANTSENDDEADEYIESESNTAEEVIDKVLESETAFEGTDSDVPVMMTSETGTDGDEDNDKTVIKKFVPIDNVIKLPKAHVKKTVGYAFEPGEKYMKFDVEISDDDDFDIP